MAYRSKSRKSPARRSYSRRPAARRARKPGVRRSHRGSGVHTVKLVIQHEQAAASINPGGLDAPQVQTQTKKAKF